MKDIEGLKKTLAGFEELAGGFDPELWLSDDRNVLVSLSEGDYNLFEYVRPGVYNGHTFYVTKGRKALDTARQVLDYVFSQTPIEVIVGYTPIRNRAAAWFNRKIGFTSHGFVRIPEGPHELFVLTKKEYEGVRDGFPVGQREV